MFEAIIASIITGLIGVFKLLFTVAFLLLIARIVLAFLPEPASHPAVVMVFRATEAMLNPVRKKMKIEAKELDIALPILFVILVFIQGIIISLLESLVMAITN